MGQNVTTETAERRVIVPKSEECEQETLGAKARGGRGGRGLLKGSLAPQISRLRESDLQGSTSDLIHKPSNHLQHLDNNLSITPDCFCLLSWSCHK